MVFEDNYCFHGMVIDSDRCDICMIYDFLMLIHDDTHSFERYLSLYAILAGWKLMFRKQLTINICSIITLIIL